MPVPILSVRDLTVLYHDADNLQFKRALEGVSLDIYAGENFALVGESGSGKTTFARAILGQVSETPGVVRGEMTFATADGEWPLLRGSDEVWREESTYFADRLIGERSRGALRRWQTAVTEQMEDVRGRRIALVTQDTGGTLNPYIAVGRQIRDAMAAAREPGESDELNHMSDAGLGADPAQLRALAARYPSQLSGGQRQRVLIAMALASEPDMIIADEPTTGLDVLRRDEIIRLFERLVAGPGSAGGIGKTLLLITHDLETARRLANRIGVLYAGRLVELASAGPDGFALRHPYSQLLFGSYDNLEFRYVSPAPGRAMGPRCRGCRYRPQCQLYAGHKMKDRKTESDVALLRMCEDREPPLFAVSDRASSPLVRCWARVGRERWHESREEN
ncbi:MAG: ABC transporter ATP-binding protein [Bradyrhizobium sp.]|nr:ABC transporter ATP-binding protein [Bradyrhizobium sp.]